jgi:hypothetical protein
MKLSEFRRLTVAHDEDTEILVLAPWGEMEPATFVEPHDLEDDDPVRLNFPPMSLLITGEAS